MRLAAPLLVFTSEEVWAETRRPAASPQSIHTTEFPQPADLTAGLAGNGAELSRAWDQLLLIRMEVLKSLEEARNSKQIGAPLEAKVVLESSGEQLDLLRRYEAELPGLFITSEVELKAGGEGALRVTVLHSTGVKCERCWKYTHDVGSDAELPTVCAPCAEVVRTMAADRP